MAPSLGRFKPEPLPVEPSGAPGHKTINPPSSVVLVTAMGQPQKVFKIEIIIIYSGCAVSL